MSLEPTKIEHLYRSYRVCVGYAIRTVEEKDLSAIEWFRSVTGMEALSQADRDRLLSGEDPLLMAELGGHPIGQIAIRMEGERGYLEDLRVLEPMRGFGIAQHLIDEAEKLCVRCGCKIACISLSHANAEGRELLNIMGYHEAEAEWMEKDIRWKSCHTPLDDAPAEELCRNDIDAAIG